MFTSIRHYRLQDPWGLDELTRRVDDDFAEAISGQPGFVSYEFAECGDGRSHDRCLRRVSSPRLRTLMSRCLTSSATATRSRPVGRRPRGQRAEFYGVPSQGRTATVQGTFIDLVRGGKIVEHWSEMSFPEFMQALSAK